MRWLQKLGYGVCYVRTGWVVFSRAIALLVCHQFKKGQKKRLDAILKDGAVRILNIAKAKASVTYQQALPRGAADTRYIFMSNHESLGDLPLIFALIMGSTRVIAKKELFEIPIFGWSMTALGCIPVDRARPSSNLDLLERVTALFQNQQQLWIFPEGSRSMGGELLPFKHGVFRLARELKAKIVPVGIRQTAQALPKGSLCVKRNQPISIHVGAPIDTCSYQSQAAQFDLVKTVRHAIRQLMTGE